jgi:hypothetical protein
MGDSPGEPMVKLIGDAEQRRGGSFYKEAAKSLKSLSFITQTRGLLSNRSSLVKIACAFYKETNTLVIELCRYPLLFFRERYLRLDVVPNPNTGSSP